MNTEILYQKIYNKVSAKTKQKEKLKGVSHGTKRILMLKNFINENKLYEFLYT